MEDLALTTEQKLWLTENYGVFIDESGEYYNLDTDEEESDDPYDDLGWRPLLSDWIQDAKLNA